MEHEAATAAALVDQCSTKEEALKAAIQAAELFLKASSSAGSKLEKAELRRKCKQLLSKAESIKISPDWAPRVRKACNLKIPSSQRVLSKREEIILLESTKLHGFNFPRWSADPDDSVFGGDLDEPPLYHDLVDLSLSAAQVESFAGWKRPQEISDGLSECLEREVELCGHLTASIDDVDLVQDITTDCSVVASLSAGIARALKGHGKLLSSIIFPFDEANARPVISRNGKYVFRMHFNGCFRQVAIDDRLPASKTSRTLHVVDRKNPLSLWPALIEKAYLKVRGGYDFPGSNSGTDLYVLTGWIPEQLFLRSDELQFEQLWSRIHNAFNYGDVMVTLGTGRLTKVEEEEFGLAGEHDYAVLDLKQTESRRLMLVKNPWCDGMVWTESGRTEEAGSNKGWTEDLAEALPLPLPPSSTFWMPFEDIIQNFDNLYLNWNPALFSHRQDHHFSWTTPQTTTSASTSLVSNPQYTLKSSTSTVVWILLSRHFATAEQDIAKRKRASLADASSALGFISLYIFDAGGWAVYLSDDAIHRGAYVDSPQTSAQVDLDPSKTYTIVVAQHGLPLPKYNYTLSFFSRSALQVGSAVDRYPHCLIRTGSWTSRTAGGNASSATYSTNPQFQLVVPSLTNIALLLETTSAVDLAVNVQLIWANGHRVTAITARDVVGTSGCYRRGCALAELRNVAAGTYTVVVSTFEAGQMGDFTLRVRSMVPCTLSPVPAETAGMLCTRLPVLRFESGHERVLAPLNVPRLTRVKLVVRNASSGLGPRPLLKVTIEGGQGPNKSVLSVSGNGEFSDAPTGVRTGNLDIGPSSGYRGGLWLVVERLGGRDRIEEVEVEVLSDMGVSVGIWGTGDG